MVRLELSEHRQHTEIATCATWAPNYELFTGSDDKQIIKWGVDGQVLTRTTVETYVTSIAWMPSVGKGSSDAYAISCADGTFRLMTGSGREEKKVAAHHGAALKVAWNFEGSALYSAGEDGELKVWSKSGNLRSTPIKTGHPIYHFATGPGGDQVCYVLEKKLCIESVGERKAKHSWVAHEATVLCVDWNLVSTLVVSGAEDCRYKVWDHFGRQLYQSQPYAHVITSVKWSPSGAYFAVGAFNMLRLCDKTGWSCCREQTKVGSLLDVSWTADGTQLAGAGGNGGIVLAQLVERSIEWRNFEAKLVGQRSISVQDVVSETYESLDFNRDRVVEFALGHGHLVVSTTTQCFIYSTSNWNTPYIFDSPETVSLIALCEKHFAVLSPSGVTVYAYDGRKISQPRFHGLRAEFLSESALALSPDVVAIVDTADRKTVRLFDVITGKPLSPHAHLTHKADLVSISLNQSSKPETKRQLALIDVNGELHLFQLQGGSSSGSSSSSSSSTGPSSSSNEDSNGSPRAYKLQTQVDTAKWNEASETLCAVADGRLVVWYYPQIAYIDRDLLQRTISIKDGAEFGKLSKVTSFDGATIVVRRADGASVTTAIAPYPSLLFEFASAARWDEATRLCRFVDDTACWTMLAAMAVEGRNLDVAEIALAALGEVDKLQYVLHMKNIASPEARAAELALYQRRPDEAEKILLQATPPLLYRAIKLNVRLFRWERALELAVKHRSHVDTVLAYRAKYLERYAKPEQDDRFKQLNQSVKWDWDQIKAKKELEKQEEANRSGGNYQPGQHK